MNRSLYLDMREAAEELRTLHCKDPLEAARQRLQRNGIHTEKIGNTVYVLRSSLDEARKRGRATRTRRPQLVKSA